MPAPRPASSAALSLVLLGLSGCGYSLGYRIPPNVRTIAVPIFNNETFPLRREVEYELTSAVRKEIQARTPLDLVDEGAADLAILGTIRQFRERTVAEGRRDEKIESTLSIEVAIVVEDYRNQRQFRERVVVHEPVSIQIGETLDAARRRAIGNLAERILEVVEWWPEDATAGGGP